MSVKEVSEAMSMSPNTIYSLLKNRDIAYIQVKKKYYIPKISLINFVNNQISATTMPVAIQNGGTN